LRCRDYASLLARIRTWGIETIEAEDIQACAVAIFSIPLETESSWSPTERAKFR
jgi:hypothetical protein